ncbi:MAG: hypothetical protein OEY21_11115, partial [Nitrospira sp.]|nr:hypothetical protein [Nitrospira sp.]
MGEWHIPEPVRERLERTEPADILLGVVTFNDSATAPGLTRALAHGIARSFPQRRAIVVNCDAGSLDGTPQAIQEKLGPETQYWAIRHPVLGASLKL